MRHVKCYIENYPRPQFVRNEWQSLNGKWEFAFDCENLGESNNWKNGNFKQHEINVPFAYQCELSGIGNTERCDHVWYARKFEYGGDKRCILNFEGCDYITKVWVNGEFVGRHQGGYTRFSFDVTSLLKKGKNLLVVKAEDSYSCFQPRGKQRWQDENYGCWYVDTTGIWKTVWLEFVERSYLGYVAVKPDFHKNACAFEGKVEGFRRGLKLKTSVSFQGKFVCDSEIVLTNNVFKQTLDLTSEVSDFKVKTWSCNCPDLYDVEYILSLDGQEIDRVGSYFGVADFSAHGNLVTLNDGKFYAKMLLDQGYFDGGHLTPPSEAAIIKDVELTKAMGFNGIRKHQKVEDDRFYYYCDLLGIAVWCEMPSPYDFSLEAVSNFTNEWTEIVLAHLSHPSIMAWVPFNESWGVMRISQDHNQQAFTEGMYYLTKALDGKRFVISNDGWEHTKSDIITLHNYAERGDGIRSAYGDMSRLLSGKNVCGDTPRQPFASGYQYEGQPVMISEYAGIALRRKDGKGWGYGKQVDGSDAMVERLADLTAAIRENTDICGYCVTQTTDVQQEVNGLLYSDRTPKADVKKIREINR